MKNEGEEKNQRPWEQCALEKFVQNGKENNMVVVGEQGGGLLF